MARESDSFPSDLHAFSWTILETRDTLESKVAVEVETYFKPTCPE
jgi:hypothetical protein